MSEKQFIEYAEREGYKNIRIRRFKHKDWVYVETTPSTDYPNVKKIGVGLLHHIEDYTPAEYHYILMSQTDRVAFRQRETLKLGAVK